jgi:hypothetical protein
MGPVAIIAGIATVVSAGAAYMQHKQGKKAAAAQRKAAAYQRQQDNYKAMRERREAIRTARMAAAESTQLAANQGGMDTSAYLGAQGSIQSQLAQGLSFLDTQNRLADRAGVALSQANKYEQSAAGWGAMGNFAQTVASNAGAVFGKA